MLNVSIHIKISLIWNMCLKFTFAAAMKKKICWLSKLNGLTAKVSNQLLPIPCLWNLVKIK